MPDPTLYVVCEGPTDKRILDHLLNSKLGLFVQIKVGAAVGLAACARTSSERALEA